MKVDEPDSSDDMWLAKAKAADFSTMPDPFSWDRSVKFAHIIDGHGGHRARLATSPPFARRPLLGRLVAVVVEAMAVRATGLASEGRRLRQGGSRRKGERQRHEAAHRSSPASRMIASL